MVAATSSAVTGRPSGNLEIEITIDDPKAYTRPWIVKLRQMMVADTDLLEYYCQENERDVPHVIGSKHSPPRGGGVDAPREAKAQTGWSDRLQHFAELTTPALRATPPLRGREYLVLNPM